MASPKPDSHIIASDHLSSSEPDLHHQSKPVFNDDNKAQNDINHHNITNKESSSSTTTKASTPSNELLNSLRNTANKIARSGSRKLRTLSAKTQAQPTRPQPNEKSASSSSLPSQRSPRASAAATATEHDTTQNEDDNAAKAIKRKLPSNILLHLNKTFNKNRQKSSSNPSSPIEIMGTEQTHKTLKSDIVIGATYSHSDNERIDNKLKSMRTKKSRTNFLNKQRVKRNNNKSANASFASNDNEDVNKINSGDIRIRLEQKDEAYDGDDGDEDDEKDGFSFQFLKNMKNIDTRRMNTIISQSSQSINNYIQKQRTKMNKTMGKNLGNKDINKSTSYLKAIPQKSLELWKRQQEYELNRFAKMSSQATYKPQNSLEKVDYFDTSHSILWEQRIMTDIIRAGKLFVCGEVDEIFEFPSFKCTQEKEELVRTTIRYLESAVQEAITSLLTINGVNNKQKDKDLNKDAAKEISVKCVRQALISLCQEFVNDPYFKYLKESCEDYNLQPTDIGLVGSQDINEIKSWTPRLCINITGNRIYTHIVRVFQCYQLCGIEAMETQIYFGFKRTYSIDCMGGPPWILPPIFLSHDKLKQIAYQISIPKEKVLDPMQLEMPIPDATDFIPTLQ